MNDILLYQQMLGQNTSLYQSELSIAEQENAAKEEPIETGEVGSGMIGIKMGVDKTIEAVKNKIKGKISEKVEELKDNIKSKLQEKADELKGKFEEMKQKVTPQQEEEEAPIIEEPDDEQPAPQEEGPLIEEIPEEEDIIQPSQESQPVIEEPPQPETIEEPIEEPIETPQQTSFIRRYPTEEDLETIKNQAMEDTKQFRANLVPNENVEQDSYDMNAQKLTDANRAAQKDIDNPDTKTWRARLQQKMIDKNEGEIEKIRQQKMDETGEDLNIRTPPTDEEYDQIHNYFNKRLEDLTNEKMNELNPPREAPQVEETAVPEIQETPQAIVPVTRGAVADETQALVPQTQEIQTAGDNIAKSLVKTTGEAIGEEAAEESGLAEASSVLDAIPLTEPLGILLGAASILFGIYHHPKVHNLPKVINTAQEFGA